jgi:hypothetical protein
MRLFCALYFHCSEVRIVSICHTTRAILNSAFVYQVRRHDNSPGSATLTSLAERFTQRGVPSDLDESIELHQAALLLRPPGHLLRSLSLSNLATSLGVRFRQRGVPSDIDESIELHRAALLLRPHGHSDRSLSLNNLATSLADALRVPFNLGG